MIYPAVLLSYLRIIHLHKKETLAK